MFSSNLYYILVELTHCCGTKISRMFVDTDGLHWALALGTDIGWQAPMCTGHRQTPEDSMGSGGHRQAPDIHTPLLDIWHHWAPTVQRAPVNIPTGQYRTAVGKESLLSTGILTSPASWQVPIHPASEEGACQPSLAPWLLLFLSHLSRVVFLPSWCSGTGDQDSLPSPKLHGFSSGHFLFAPAFEDGRECSWVAGWAVLCVDPCGLAGMQLCAVPAGGCSTCEEEEASCLPTISSGGEIVGAGEGQEGWGSTCRLPLPLLARKVPVRPARHCNCHSNSSNFPGSPFAVSNTLGSPKYVCTSLAAIWDSGSGKLGKWWCPTPLPDLKLVAPS